MPSHQTLYTDLSETRDTQEAKTLKKTFDVRIWVREGVNEIGLSTLLLWGVIARTQNALWEEDREDEGGGGVVV